MTLTLEILKPGATASNARVALFDFDGTVSLIRAGWVEVMVPMMVECLLELKTGESEEDLRALVEEFVGRLTGRQTIYQMIEFVEEMKKRGGRPLEPLEYKHIYLDLLNERIKDRIQALEEKRTAPDELMVPGARRLIQALKERGLKLYLASGTDEQYMKREAALLRVDQYFDGGLYGAQDDYKSFSKKILIARIIERSEFQGPEFLGFGDGFVEIENVKEVGGVAVGVATDEPLCVQIDPVKRKRLASVGADWIVPHYNAHEELMAALFNGTGR
jgi:phosphoglycolate phosphatase-like HAD superfamily hydrolase